MKFRKLFQKAAAFILVAVTALSVIPATTAFAAGDIGTISFTLTYDSSGNAMRYNSSANIGGYTAGGTGSYKYRMYVDGEDAFCIQPGVPLKTGNTLQKASSETWNALSANQKKAVGLALLYGYQGNRNGLSGSDDEKWLATQTLVWEFVTGCRESTGSYSQTSSTVYSLHFGSSYANSGARAAYDQIVSLMSRHNTIPSFMSGSRNGITRELAYKDGKYSLTFTDNNGVLSDYTFSSSNSNVSVSQSGNELTISSATPIDGSALITAIRHNTPTVSSSARLIAYGDPSLQDLVTGVENADTVAAYINVETPTGTLALKKTSEDGVVEGISFTITGEGFNKTVKTNRDGSIDVTGLIPGTYNITEQSIDRYEPQKSQTVTLIGGRTSIVNFNNTLKRGSLEVIKTSEDNLVEGVRFHLYGTSLSGLPVDEYAVTNAQGVAKFENALISGNTPYVVEEVDTAIRYVVPASQTAPIEWNKVTSRSFTNILKKFNITVTKSDVETGTPQGDASLAGAVYGIFKGETLIDTYTTDKNGQFTTDYYVCGYDWTIREISPSEGYLLDNTVHKIGAEPELYTVERNSTANDVTEQVIKGNISIIKHTDNGETQIETPEDGAAFEVFLKSAGSYDAAKATERDILVCDENGFAQTKDMPYGVYTVLQTSGWEGRELMKAFDVFINSDGHTYRYLINNANFESYIKIVKKDAETGKTIPYAGAGFQLYDPSGTLVSMTFTYPEVTTIDTFYTTADGELITPEKLEYGTGYSLVEVQAPYGYVRNSEPVYFDVMQENSEEESGITLIEVVRSNMAQKGTVTVSKFGEIFSSVAENDGLYQPIFAVNGLEDAVYEITAAEDIYTLDGTPRATKGEVVDTVTTGADGTQVSKELYLGKYEVREITAPYGMVLNDEIHEVELVYAGQNIAVTETATSFYNERQRVKIDLIKSLEIDEAYGIGKNGEIFDVSFGLYATEDLTAADGTLIPADSLIEIITLDENGKGKVQTDLPVGGFYVKELSTSSAYIISDEKFPVDFEYAGQDTATVSITANNGESIENNIIYGSVSGKKADEDGNALGGAVIGIFKTGTTEFTTETAIVATTSADDGGFSFENVPYGTWVIREIESPTGFVLSEEEIAVTINEVYEVVEIELVNYFIKGNIELTKVDKDYPDNKLSGAVFEVYADTNGNGEIDDELLDEMTELEGGIYQMNELRYGKYLVREKTAPEGFLLDETVYSVSIEENGKTYMVENEAGMDEAYKKSCRYVEKKLIKSNESIMNLLRALGRQDIRSLLNFERVISYLEAILTAPSEQLPHVVANNLYMLGLLASNSFGTGAPTVDTFRAQIKRNHELVSRISGLEQKERQNITNYAARNPDNPLVRQILNYYQTRDIELLRMMDIDEVEDCLKSAATPKKKTGTSGSRGDTKERPLNATTATARLVFDNNIAQIDSIIDEVSKAVEERSDNDKADTITIPIGGSQLKVEVEPVTENISSTASTKAYWGGRLYADVKNPKDALGAFEKYDFKPFDEKYIDERVLDYLNRAKKYIRNSSAAEDILSAFIKFSTKRQVLLQYRDRLQDIPMLQVINKYSDFAEYLSLYEQLLGAIKTNFSVLWDEDSIGARDIVNTIISLDFVYVLGAKNNHAIPTPLNPLYLWKYIMLAQEMLEEGSAEEGQEHHLSDDDKSFIIRKAEDIPDPLTLVLVPNSIVESSECLPVAGRIGCLPVYSTKPQINEGNTGMDIVQQGIVRYMCLYPHSSMLLRITFINPPTVESVIGMLKKLDRDKEFSAYGNVGIDLTIYRTKEASADWVELKDKSLNDGMLAKIIGKKTGRFNLSIVDKNLSYDDIISRLDKEQHLLVVFDPNERYVDLARNSKQIHIHPLCVPKVYEYNRIQGSVKIRPANEGGIFADYAGILEKLREQPSSFGHRSVFVNSPLKEETYKQLLDCADWLMILDENLKSWDVSLRSASEKLYYKSSDHRSVGIYSKNSGKFVLGYNQLIASLGNYIPSLDGVQSIIEAIRGVNDDGLLSIASHSTNSIFDKNHGKGSLGLAIAALNYKQSFPDALLVGLDTQLAREWLSDREDGKLPDLIGLHFANEDRVPQIDIIEVKTYTDYSINQGTISGNAVEQTLVLQELIREMFGHIEKITTVSRREILREQVFECLFHSNLSPDEKYEQSLWLNKLFAGEYAINPTKTICHVDFENNESSQMSYHGDEHISHEQFMLIKLGCERIQEMLSRNLLPQAVSSNGNPISSNKEEIETPDVNPTSIIDNSKYINRKSVPPLQPATPIIGDTSDKEIIIQEEKEKALDPEIEEKCTRLNLILKGYGIKANPVDPSLVQQAARFTRFKIELKPGETIKKLIDKSQDIARELEAYGEIFIDNVKGTRYVGMDVPFNSSGQVIELLENLHMLDRYEGSLDVLAGQAPDGTYQVIDLAKAPHMLVAGTTGSGKTVFLYSIIVSLLYKEKPDNLELLIVDPKQTDFHFFEKITNLRGRKVLTDAEEALAALAEINNVEKEQRTQLIRSDNCRDIDSYNAKNPDAPMKRLVIVIDEYADLIQAAELQGKEVKRNFETNLCMLAQRVRNLGIHLIIATQQPRATIVTSSLKAVLPYRTSFRLPSHVDSQTILDRAGAEDLLGKGDMLLMTDSDLLRMQGFYISEEQLVQFIGKQNG